MPPVLEAFLQSQELVGLGSKTSEHHYAVYNQWQKRKGGAKGFTSLEKETQRLCKSVLRPP